MYYDLLKKKIYCNDEIFGRYIRNNQIWEENIVLAICDNLKSDSMFIDVGANIGLISLFVNELAQVDNLEIVCFEPCDENYNCLIKNRTMNMKCFPTGLSDSEGLLSMVKNRYNMGTCRVYDDTIETIDEIFEDAGEFYFETLDTYEFYNVSVIKIDVEGHELEVLKGAKSTIEKNRPVIVIEIFDEKFDLVNEYMESIYYYKSEKLNTCDYIYFPQA